MAAEPSVHQDSIQGVTEGFSLCLGHVRAKVQGLGVLHNLQRHQQGSPVTLTWATQQPATSRGHRCGNSSLGLVNSCFSIKQHVMVGVAGNCSWPEQLCWRRELACLPKGILLSPEGNTTNPTRVACDKLWEICSRRRKLPSSCVCTHLVDLPTGETVKPFQAQRENLGGTVHCEPLGGSNILLTP